VNYHLYLSIYLYLWIAPHVILLGLAIQMVRTGLHKNYPIFFSYVLFEWIQFVVLFAMYALHLHGPIYTKMDTIGRLASIALRFAIVQELLEKSVAGDVSVRRKLSWALNGIAIVLIILAIGFIASLYYSILSNKVQETQVIIQALNVAQCGLLVLVFLWHRFLGLQMAPLAFGVAIGMGLVAGSEPLRKALTEALGIRYAGYLNLAQMGIYHISVWVWLYYALARKGSAASSESTLPKLREQTAEIGRILQR
jgi:hypothetical protein